MRTLAPGAIVAVVASVVRCADAHRVGSDLGPWYVDAGPVVYPPPCEASSECSGDSYCLALSVCTQGEHIPCVVTGLHGGPTFSANAEPCALTARPFDEPSAGITLPASLCVALADPNSLESQTYAGVFDDGCVWSEGSPVTGPLVESGCYGFAPIELPDIGEGPWAWRFCGGSCDYQCGELPEEGEPRDLVGVLGNPGVCVARSDDRSFGVCALDLRRCSQADLSGVANCVSEVFLPLLGELATCACMFTDEHVGAPAENAEGWVVPREVCLRYREIFPESVACRDASFALID